MIPLVDALPPLASHLASSVPAGRATGHHEAAIPLPSAPRQASLEGAAAGYYLRVSVTDACNLRCAYCRPATGGESACTPPLSVAEWRGLLALLADTVSLHKIRFTGGEPLLRADLPEWIDVARREVPTVTLAVTTNGTRLARFAKPLRDAGVTALNVSIDSPTEAEFTRITRGGRLADVLAGLEVAAGLGFAPLRLNAVLLRSVSAHARAELLRLATRFGAELRFIELMPLGEGAGLFADEYLPAAYALSEFRREFSWQGRVSDSATAQRHRFGVDGVEGVVGIIPTVSEPFCGTCDRLRLDARGRLWTCLRAVEGYDLLTPWRRGDTAEVRRRIEHAVAHKRPPAPFDTFWPSRAMVGIGG